MNRLRRVLLAMALGVLAVDPGHGFAQRIVPIGGPSQRTGVPAWDSGGQGQGAWQAVACIDVSDDGSRIAVGTTAPPGDPNTFLVDSTKTGPAALVGQYSAGERWIEAVRLSDRGRAVSALCTTPQGTAGDVPEVRTFGNGSAAPEVQRADGPTLFHYGDHSNHAGVFLCGSENQTTLVAGGQATWLPVGPGAKARRLHGGGNVTTAAACGPDGLVVAGCVAGFVEGRAAEVNLFLLDPAAGKPRWSRPMCRDTDAALTLEPGQYGPPAPPFRDERIWAPLAVAVSPDGRHVACADYQGWQRVFLASGLRREQSYGHRFPSSRPTIQVYDALGKPIRRFSPEQFAEPFWCDLVFCANGSRLLAYPHAWTCRGLAGQPLLPADPAVRTVYSLCLDTGEVTLLRFPDTVSCVAVAAGTIAVGCWNGQVYRLDEQLRPIGGGGIAVGGPSLIRITPDGRTTLVATAAGVLRMFDAEGRAQWELDLNRAARHGDKPWTRNQKASAIAPGIWSTNGGRTHSDLGGQYVIEAPEGLILIDPNAGLSLEQNWARLEGAGLDPRRVRYVLLTHEHGDHAPGAYLWRVLTGAQVVASAETAYILQHHVPNGTGYGFHPPCPVDIPVTGDTELHLAGLKVRAIRVPGHTFGSMAWMFAKDGKTWVAVGDLIMPGGVLGYAGSINFRAEDALASLRKLQQLRPDGVLAGHGPHGDPAPYFQGIEVGEATGWGKMKPPKPDPLYGFQQRDYLVVAWGEPIQSATFGDADGDGQPDVAVLVSRPRGSAVKIYLNRRGRFAEQPDATIEVPEIDGGFKLRMGHVNGDRIADYLVSSESVAMLLASQDAKLAFRSQPLPGAVRATQLLTGDFDRDGRTDCLVGGRFVGGYHIYFQSQDGRWGKPRSYSTSQPYFDLALIALGGGPAFALATSGGELFLRRPEGGFEETPGVLLPRPGKEWTFMAAGDFNGDRRPDLVLIAREPRGAKLAVFAQTDDPRRPFLREPNRTFDFPLAREVLRDGPTAGDANGDGICDLVLGAAQEKQAWIFLGSKPGGLHADHRFLVPLDYAIHYDTRLGLADFDADGQVDLAGFGHSPAGAAGVYVRTSVGQAIPGGSSDR